MYYEKKSAVGKTWFDHRPQGVIPLEGAVFTPVSRGPSGAGLTIESLMFASDRRTLVMSFPEGEAQRDEWLAHLQAASSVTFDAALQGQALITKLSRDVKSAKAAVATAKSSLEADVARLTAELEATKGSRIDLEAAAEAHKADRLALQTRIQSLESIQATQDSALQSARAQIETLQADVAAAVKDKAAAVKEVSQLKSQLADQAASVSAAHMQVQRAQEEAQAVRDELATVREEVEAKEDDNAGVKDDLFLMAKEKQTLERQLTAARQQIARLTEEHKRKEASLRYELTRRNSFGTGMEASGSTGGAAGCGGFVDGSEEDVEVAVSDNVVGSSNSGGGGAGEAGDAALPAGRKRAASRSAGPTPEVRSAPSFKATRALFDRTHS